MRFRLAVLLGLLLFFPAVTAHAQVGTGSAGATTESTANDEAAGKVIWDKVQSKQIPCTDLQDDDFELLGEYSMGRMLGDAHEAMNRRAVLMMGKQGEEKMHIAMGKRLSGCFSGAPFPQGMMGGWANGFGSATLYPMMGFGFGPFGFLFMILWWVLLIVGIVALVRWLISTTKGTQRGTKTALDILRERYAKGEIDKKEFTDRKRHLEG